MKRLFVVLDLSLLRQPEEEQRQAVLRQLTTALGRLWAAYLHDGPGGSGASGRRNSWGYLLYDSACAELILKPVLRKTAQTLRLPVGFQETIQTDCRGAQLVQLVALVDALSAHPPAGDSPAGGPAREAPAAALSRALQSALSGGYLQKLRELAEDESASGSTARAQGLLAAFTPPFDSAEQLQGWLGRAGCSSGGDVQQLQPLLLDAAFPAALWQRCASGCLGLCWVPATETQPAAMQELLRQRCSNAAVAPLAQLAGPSSWAEFAARLALPVPHAEVGPRRRGAADDDAGWMDAAGLERDALDHLKLAVAELEGHSERALEEAKRQARAEHRQLARKRQGLPPQAARRGAAPAAKKGEALLENARRAAADKSRNPSRPTSVQGTPVGAAAASDDQHNVLAAAAAAVAGAAVCADDEGEVESVPALAPEAAVADLKGRVAELVASLAAAKEPAPTQDVLAQVQALVRTTFLAARSYGQRVHPGAGSGGGSPADGGSAHGPERPTAQDPLSVRGLRALLLQQVPAAVADLRRQHSKSEEPWQRAQLAQRLLVELLLRLCICAWGERPGSSLPPRQYSEVEVLMQCLVATLQPIPQAGHDLFSGTVAGAFGTLFPGDVARLQDELWEPDFDPDFDQMLREHRIQGAEHEETGETPNCSTGQVASGAAGPARRPQRQSSSVLTGGRSGAAGGGAGPSNLGRAALGQRDVSGREGHTSSRPSAGTARQASSELSGEHSGVQGGASGATAAGAVARSGAAVARAATSRDDLINLSHIRQRYNNTRQFELQVRSKLPPSLAQTRKLKNAVATSRPMPLKVAGAASRGGASATSRQQRQPQHPQRKAARERHQQVPATPDSRGKALLQAAAAAVERRRDQQQQQQQQQASALHGAAVVSPDDAPVLPRGRDAAEPGRADEVPETAARPQPHAAQQANPELMRGASLRLDFGAAPQFPGSLLASQPEGEGDDGQPPPDGTAPAPAATMTWMVAATRVGRGAARAPSAAEFGIAAADEESQPLLAAPSAAAPLQPTAASGLDGAGSGAEAAVVPADSPLAAREPDGCSSPAEEEAPDGAAGVALLPEPSAAAPDALPSEDPAAAPAEPPPSQRETRSRSRGRVAPRVQAGVGARGRSKSGGRATPGALSRGRGNPAAATPAGPPQGQEQAGARSADGGTLRRSSRHTAGLPADGQQQVAQGEGPDMAAPASQPSRRRSGRAAVQAAQASVPGQEEVLAPEPPSAAAPSAQRRTRSSAAAAAEAEADDAEAAAAAQADAGCPEPTPAGVRSTKRHSRQAASPPAEDQAAAEAACPRARQAAALSAKEAAESLAAADQQPGTSERDWPWKLGCAKCRANLSGCTKCRQTVKAQLKEAGLAGVLHVVTIACGSDCTKGGEHPGCTQCWTAVVQLLRDSAVEGAAGSGPVLECAAAPEVAINGAASRPPAQQAGEAQVAACDGAEASPPASPRRTARSGPADEGQPGQQAAQQAHPGSRSRPRRSQQGASLSQQPTADAPLRDAAAGAVSRGRGTKRQAPRAEPPAVPADVAAQPPVEPTAALPAEPGQKRRRTRQSGPQPKQLAALEETGQQGPERPPAPVATEAAGGAASPGHAEARRSRRHQLEQAAAPPAQPKRSSRGRELEAGGGGLRRGRSAGTPMDTAPSQEAASAGAAGLHPQSRSRSPTGRAALKGTTGAADASQASPVALAAAAAADAAVADAEAGILAAAAMHSLPAADPQGTPSFAEAPQVLAPPPAAPHQLAQAGAAQPPVLLAHQLAPEDREVQAALLSVGCLASQLDGGADSGGEGAVSQGGVSQRHPPGSYPVSDAALAHLTAEQLLQAQVVGMDTSSPAGDATGSAPSCGQAAAAAVQATPGQAPTQRPQQPGQSQEASGHPQRRRHSSAGGFKSSKGRLAAMHGSGKARKRAAAAEVTSSGGPKRRAPSGGGSRSPLPQLARRVAAASEGAAAAPPSPYEGGYAFLEGAAAEAGAVEAAEVVADFSPATAPAPSAAAPAELAPAPSAAAPDAASPTGPAAACDARRAAQAVAREAAADLGSGAAAASPAGGAAASPASPGGGAEASSQHEVPAGAAAEDSPPRQAERAQQAQQSPVLSAATRGPAPPSSLDPRALARAAQLQQQVSAQLTARKAGRPERDGGNPRQRRQREQPGSPADSCLDSAMPDSQLQHLSPLDAAAGAAPQLPVPSAQPTPQSRQQRRLSPAGALQGKQQQQQVAVPRLAEQPVPRPCVGDRLLFGSTDLSRSELEVAEVKACEQLPCGFRLHISARLVLEGLEAAPLLHVRLDSANWVPPDRAVSRKDHWQLLPRQAAAPPSSARPAPAPLPLVEAPGATARHNTAARQQQRRLSTDSLVLPQSAAQRGGLLAALGGAGQQAPASVATLPKQLDFGCGPAAPARQPGAEAGSQPSDLLSMAAAAANITPRRLPRLTDLAQQRCRAGSPARPTHVAASLAAAAPPPGPRQPQPPQHAPHPQQAPPAGNPGPDGDGDGDFDPDELAAALPHAPPEVAVMGARICADLCNRGRGLVLPLWVLRPEDELHPGYVVTLCRRERSGLPLVQELLLLKVQRHLGSSPKKHSHSVTAMVLGEGLGSNLQPCRSLRVEAAELRASGLQLKAAGVRASGHWHASRQLASAASADYVFDQLELALATIRRHQLADSD